MTKHNRLSPDELKDLRTKAEAIEHKRWTARQTTMHAEMFVHDERGFLMEDGVVSGPTYKKTNTEFIAAADPETVLNLLGMVERLQSELAVSDSVFRSLKDSVGKTDSDLILLKRENAELKRELGR